MAINPRAPCKMCVSWWSGTASVFCGFLALAGIVTPQQLVKFSRYAIVSAFVIGAFVTPGPEISSQIAVSGALIALYFISVGLAFLIARKKKEAREEA